MGCCVSFARWSPLLVSLLLFAHLLQAKTFLSCVLAASFAFVEHLPWLRPMGSHDFRLCGVLHFSRKTGLSGSQFSHFAQRAVSWAFTLAALCPRKGGTGALCPPHAWFLL